MPNFFRHGNTLVNLDQVAGVHVEMDNKSADGLPLPRVVIVLTRATDMRYFLYPDVHANASLQVVWDALTALVTEIEDEIYDDAEEDA